MKNSRFLFVNVLYVAIVASLIVCSSAADASESPKTKPGDAKMSGVPEKNVSAPKNESQANSMPASARSLPYNTLQQETLPESQNSARAPFYGMKPAETITGATTENALRGESLQKIDNGEGKHFVPSAAIGSNADVENSGSAQIFLILAAFCSALAGTAVILYLVSKRVPQKEETNVGSQEIKQEVQPQAAAPLLFEEKPAEQVDVEVSLNEEPAEENAAVELAQRYHRGQGEMQLLFSLQSHENEKAPITQLLHTSSLNRTDGSRKKLAKKLGLGNGELDLLVRLQKTRKASHQSQRML